jgi:putative ABC transport system permease protein
MRIIVKALVSSLLEKKARTFLVLFSIAVSAALIFANESFAKTVTQRFYDADVRWGGNSDYYIETKAAVGAEEWIDPEKLAGYGDIFEYVFPFIKEKALYMPSLERMHYFTIIGVDIETFNRHNPLSLLQGDFNDWNGYKIIIGTTYANEYHLKVGDTLKLELNNAEFEFQIAGISAAKGLFLRDLADGGFILAPKDTISQIFDGDSNLVFLKLKDRSQREGIKEKLTHDFAAYNVKYGINDAVIEAETLNYVMPFRVASIVVVFMCMFIIYTAFNLITLERIPIVGTLRSIGCTRKKINAILIVESACLGATGGLFGCLLGILVLQYIKSLSFTGDDAALNSTVLFGVQEVLAAVGAAVLITTASAVLPILRLTKTPIKNIILNDTGKRAGKKGKLWIAGLVLMAACLLIPPFLSSNFIGMMIGCLLATGALVGLVPVVPFLTDHLARLIGKLPFLSQEVVLGVRNIRDNTSLMNNIQLFSAAIAIVAFMASMFNTMGADLIQAFVRDMKFDLVLVLRHSDPQTLARLAQVEGVEASAGSYQTHTAILNHGTFLNVLYGIEDAGFFQFNPVRQLEENQEALETLNDGKNIITTNVLKSKLGLEKGDTLLIQFGSDPVAYTITGFVETNVGIGHVGYISAANYRQDMGVSDYDFIHIQAAGGAEQVKNNLLRSLNKEVMSIQTKAELTAANADKVIALFNAIRSYCYLALLVGIIGILNNLVASFIERKRSFAMYRCVGMSKKSLNRMLITEAVGMGVFGVGFGILCALIMSSAIPVSVSVLWGNVTVQLAFKEMAIIAVVGILAMLAISAVPVLRSEKMSLIETIQYE